jgi:energy-coupling factor transporter ATP-binding protein EcfA2
VLSPTSTVLETLIFAAQLRLPENIPKSIKEQRAQTVLTQLGLTDVAHTRVGSVEHRGISGGEMRRVSIGIELVAAPDVLVLDEPTSGLDSVSAARLVKVLRNLAEEEKTTIVASIHQPSSALYHSFNQVVLLAKGRQLYFGPGGTRPTEYFASQGRPCPQGYNIADHLLEIASSSNEGMVTGPAAMIGGSENGDLSGSSSNSEVKRSLEPARSESERGLVDTPFAEKGAASYPPMTGPVSLSENGKELDLATLGEGGKEREWWPRSHCATTYLTQIEVLSGREWRNLKRCVVSRRRSLNVRVVLINVRSDKTLLVAHILLACILGVFAGGLYYKVNLTIAGFQNRIGSLFFLGSLIAFSSLSALYNLVEVRSLFLRERSGNFYSPQAWLLSRVLFDVIPLRLIPTVLVGVIVYFMVGLSRQAAEFFKFLLIIVEFSLAMCLFVSLVSRERGRAGLTSCVLFRTSSWLVCSGMVESPSSSARCATSFS